MLNQKEEFLQKVQKQIDSDASILGDLFKLVSDNWNKMVEAQRNERESTHLRALGEMLDNLWSLTVYKRKVPSLLTNMECCTILEALDAVDPSCTGGSEARKQLFAHIANSCRALGWKPDDTFIKDIRGKSELLTNLYKNFKEGNY